MFLLPLPPTPFELAAWKVATVQYNYHVSVDRMNYSVPYEYIKQQVDVRLTRCAVEVFFGGTRIASHPRLLGRPNQYSTNESHMPPEHQEYLQWNGDRFLRWARQFKEQLDDPQFASMSFEDRFSILVDAEWSTRKSNHLKSLIKNAGYAIPGASVEDIEYLPDRKLDKSQILDEWLLYPLKESEARDVLELVEARAKTASTIFCSQFDVPGWHGNLYDPTLADAICDRIVYDSYIIRIEGDTMRKRKGIMD